MPLYKNIIPGLLSFDTNLTKLNGFTLSYDFDFYEPVSTKNKFHYEITDNHTINIPDEYDIRCEYFIKKDNYWFYKRSFFVFDLLFSYNFEQKKFSFNQFYMRLPSRVGGIATIGENISSIIELDMFLKGYLVLRGGAIKTNDDMVIGISAPGFNGKTTYIKKSIENGSVYISEDHLILHHSSNSVYPTSPQIEYDLWRPRNMAGIGQVLNKNNISERPNVLDKLYFIENGQSEAKLNNKKLIDYLWMNSMYFMNNLLVEAYVYENGYSTLILDILNSINLKYEFVRIKDFKYELN